ncbi:MAG TPA: 1-acyl-sn-glycerol-3-phosphate acyltransferase [Bacillota bacterium]|nr:1-acyl-sn-glycerol-3-phosphate acyltransferase [Bacillota bacterium]
MIQSLENTLGLFGELWRLQNLIPEIKLVLQYFNKDKNPRPVLEKIFNTSKKNPILDNLLKVSKTYEMISRVEKRTEAKGWHYACQEAVKEMGVSYKIKGIENIPAKEGALYVCNHPYGIVDGAILFGGLSSLLEEKGRKLKVIVRNHLKFIKGIEKEVYFVTSKKKKINLSSIRGALRHLDNGGDLALYPSGKESKKNLKEYPWNNGLETFISHSNYVVPMWFSGPDHAKIYDLLSRFKKTEKLRSIFSLREAWNKEGKTVVLNIGKPIKSSELKERKDIPEKGEYLRKIAETLKIAI